MAEAYRAVAEEGLLEIVHGHGARVVQPERSRPASPEIAGDFRRRLRELVAGMRARGLSPKQVAGELEAYGGRTGEALIQTLNIGVRLMNIGLIYLMTWKWLTSEHAFRNQAARRAGAAFSAYASTPNFRTPLPAGEIMRQFRGQVWIWTSVMALAFAVTPGGITSMIGWSFGALMVAASGNYFLFPVLATACSPWRNMFAHRQ